MKKIQFNEITVREFWSKHPSLSSLFLSMHEIESWVLDGEYDVYKGIEDWLANLTPKAVKNIALKADSLIVLFFYMKTQNAMYLYKKLIELEPSLDRTLQFTANNMLADPSKKVAAAVFWDRFRHMMLDGSIEKFLGETQLKNLHKCIEYVNNAKGTICES